MLLKSIYVSFFLRKKNFSLKRKKKAVKQTNKILVDSFEGPTLAINEKEDERQTWRPKVLDGCASIIPRISIRGDRRPGIS